MFRPILAKFNTTAHRPLFRSAFHKSPGALTLSIFAPTKRFATHLSSASVNGYATRTSAVNWRKVLTQLALTGGTIVGLNVFFNRETREGGIPVVEQEYLHETFKYMGAGLGITALAAKGLHNMGWSTRLMSMNRWLVMGGGLALSIGPSRTSLT
jgi:growth hormone-inducible transmembrane protein